MKRKKCYGNDLKNKMRLDNRFCINDASLNYIFRRNVTGYSLATIRVGEIRRYYNKKVFSLYKTDPYKYLENPSYGDKYAKYCEGNREDNTNRSIQTFDQLTAAFSTSQYDIKKGAIVVDQYNFIMDGQHRACILLKKYGPDYKINVVKIRLGDYSVKTFVLNAVYNLKCCLKVDC